MICRYEMENNLRIFHIYVTRTIVYPRVTEEKIYIKKCLLKVCVCVDSYSQMLDLPAFFSSNSEIMGVVCTHGVGRFHEPSRSSNFGAPQSWDPWDTPKSPFSCGENDWELRTFCSQASNLKPLGTGQPGAC